MEQVPDSASVVVVGGGVIGCSVIYHLSKLGYSDAVLIEKAELSAGTTWHSAAVVAPTRTTAAMTELSKYTISLYSGLEQETGLSTGWRETGQIDAAPTHQWMDALTIKASRARAFGVQAVVITPEEALERMPLIPRDKLVGAVWYPETGRVDPTNVCQAMAKAARNRGARICAGVEAIGVEIAKGAVRGVETSAGRIRCDRIINCAGIWGRRFAQLAGIRAPLYACEHIYAITEPIAGIDRNTPNVRCGYMYAREEVGGLMVGFFEPNPKPLPLDQLPKPESFVVLPTDMDHFLPHLEYASEVIPALGTTGFRSFFSGPEAFTPDHEPLLGESAELAGFYFACGMNSSGVLLGGGIGWAMAEWIDKGRSPVDLDGADVKRFQTLMDNPRVLKSRVPEVLAKTFDIPFPDKQYKTARNLQCSPVHSELVRLGAQFRQIATWERPAYFDPNAETEFESRSFGRPPWHEHVAREHHAARNELALFDLSPFTKFAVQGRDAVKYLNRITTSQMDVELGRIVYTLMLNEAAGIEAEITVTRTSEHQYWVVAASTTRLRLGSWMQRNILKSELVSITDESGSHAALSIAGPKSRQFIAQLADTDLDNDSFPYGFSRMIDLGRGNARISRTALHGELGYEIFIPSEQSVGVFCELSGLSEAPKLHMAGDFALESLRIEKGIPSWGLDFGSSDGPYEVGLGFAVTLRKGADFVGRDALDDGPDHRPSRKLMLFKYEDHDAWPVDRHPIYADGQLSGYTTSHTFGYSVGSPLSFGWLNTEGRGTDELLARKYEIEIGRSLRVVHPSLKGFYDPAGTRMRS